MGLILHKEKGLNPKLTICPQCGGDAEELILIGIHDKKYKCSHCNQIYFGYPKRGECIKCGFNVTRIGEVGEYEKLPASQPCDKCKAKNKAVEKAVAEGGIHWNCKDCGSAGAFGVNHPLSAVVRKQMNIQAPDPVGVELNKVDGCPVCSQKEKG